MRFVLALIVVLSFGFFLLPQADEAEAEWFFPCTSGQRALNVSLPPPIPPVKASSIDVETQIGGSGAWYYLTKRTDQKLWEDWNFTTGFLRTCLPVNGSLLVGVYRVTCPGGAINIVDLRLQEQSLVC